MKIKLLKKIKKEYEITKYSKLSDNLRVNWVFTEAFEKNGNLLYIVGRSDDVYGMSATGHDSFQEAKDEVLRRVRVRYGEGSKKRRTISKKVWP